jgi:hypothetical protein
VIRIDTVVDDKAVTGRSVEVFRFDDDGSVLMRTWWEPEGEMLEEYAKGPTT